MNAADVIADRVIEVPHICRWHSDQLGETAIAIDAYDLRIGADVSVASAAEKASAVDDVSFRGDSVSFLDIGDEASDFDDFTGELVPNDERRLASSLRPVVPV